MRICSPDLADPTEELEEDYDEPADVGIGSAAESDDMKSQAKAVVDEVLSSTDKLISSIIDDPSRFVTCSVSLSIHFQSLAPFPLPNHVSFRFWSQIQQFVVEALKFTFSVLKRCDICSVHIHDAYTAMQVSVNVTNYDGEGGCETHPMTI
jgi:hypothetical protein